MKFLQHSTQLLYIWSLFHISAQYQWITGTGLANTGYIRSNIKQFRGRSNILLYSGKSTRKIPQKRPVQFTGNAFSPITNVMLNRPGFLGFVIFKGRVKKVKASAPTSLLVGNESSRYSNNQNELRLFGRYSQCDWASVFLLNILI